MPDWKSEIRRQLARLQLAPTRENAIVEELAAHLDESYAELLASGVSEADAYRQTQAELHEPIPLGEPIVACGWPLEAEGRKQFTASALVSADGRILARARHRWVQPRASSA